MSVAKCRATWITEFLFFHQQLRSGCVSMCWFESQTFFSFSLLMCSPRACSPRFHPHLFTQSATCKIRLQNVFLYWLIKMKIKFVCVCFHLTRGKNIQAQASKTAFCEIASAIFFFLPFFVWMLRLEPSKDIFDESPFLCRLFLTHTHANILSCIIINAFFSHRLSKQKTYSNANSIHIFPTIVIENTKLKKNGEWKIRTKSFMNAAQRTLNSLAWLWKLSCAEI